MTVDSIVDNSGTHLTYTHASNLLSVHQLPILQNTDPFDFKVYYHGHPTEGGFQAFTFTTASGNPVMSSLSEPYFARTWWPCKDRMDDKADSFYIALKVDNAFYAASNGVQDSIIDNGDGKHTFYYHVGYPMATYLFSVAISNYTVWHDEWVYNSGLDTMLIEHAVFPAWYVYSLSHFNVTPNALDHLSDAFGLYPYPDEKYGHANFTWGGGMEHQTMTSMGASSFGFSEPVVVHELGHQWWGDMITCKTWGHIWLNEGWASYAEAVYYLAQGGWPAYHSYMNGMAYTGGEPIYVYDTNSVNTIFASIVYDKGAWVCHMLRGVLGEAAFADAVAAYYNSEFKFGAATTEDFRDVVENATGVELDWFFEDWIYGTYFPNYRYSYFQQAAAAGGFDLYLKVEQRQASQPVVFRMPVDFAIHRLGTSQVDTLVLKCDDRSKIFKLHFPTQVTSIELDPSDWILKYESSDSWSITIVTDTSEIAIGKQYAPYADTILTLSSISSSIQIIYGALPNGLTLATTGEITGIPTETGLFEFQVLALEDGTGRNDSRFYTMEITPSVPGDVDNNGQLDISDLLYIVDFFFAEPSGPAPAIMFLADVNADCIVDISDLLSLVDYFFADPPGSSPLPGCAF